MRPLRSGGLVDGEADLVLWKADEVGLVSGKEGGTKRVGEVHNSFIGSADSTEIRWLTQLKLDG